MLNVGSSTAQVYVGITLASEVYLGTVKVWPDKAPELFTFPYVSGLATQHNWNIPAGAKHVDVILCGGGGGGSNGTLVLGNGKGGSAGLWKGIRLTPGVDTAPGSLIQFSVGNPGEGGGALNTPGRGGSTGATYKTNSGDTLPTVIGDGGKPLDAPGVEGVSSGNFTYNGYTYPGGAGGGNPGTGPGKPGTAPGGGGGGGGSQFATQLGAAGGGGIAYARVFYS